MNETRTVKPQEGHIMHKKSSTSRGQSQEALSTFLHDFPKTEIHLHIEGLVTSNSIWALIQKHKLDLGISSKKELEKRFKVRSLTEFIDLFINIIQACFLEEEDLAYLVDDAESYLVENNIRYAEIFVAPTKLLQNGIDFDRLIGRLDKGATRIAKKGITVRYIVDVSRGFGVDNAMRNLELTLKHRKDSVIGLGLGGAEQAGPAREYQPVFDRAREAGLHVVAHAGEDVGPESIWETVKLLQVDRIGHGTSAILDRGLMRHIRDHQIPLEICPTSNLYTRKYATTLKDHPIRPFFDFGIFVTVNTDDPTLFGVSLFEEYERLIEAEVFTLPEVVQIIRNGVFATFLSEAEKKKLWSEALKYIKGSPYAELLSEISG
jgi:adenosine deaminase